MERGFGTRRLAAPFAVLLLGATLGAQVGWSGFEARSRHAIAHDPVRNCAVLFGGASTGAGFLADTWEFDGSAWRRASPAASPDGRNGHAAVYDAARGETVLFGGATADRPVGETWRWNGDNWSLDDPVTVPPPRTAHAMAYDELRRVVVLFGGISPSGTLLDDTWTWDGTTWTRRTPATPPSPRAFTAMAFDAASGKVVLVAGDTAGDGTAPLDDTWEWDGAQWALRNLSATNRPNQVLWGHTLTRGPAGRGPILYGGRGVGNTVATAYEWRGTGWAQIADGPERRNLHAAAFDGPNDRVLVHGGVRHTHGVALSMSDTYELRYTGGAFVWRLLTGGPDGRVFAGAAFDPSRARIVVHGGLGRDDRVVRSDTATWAWDGALWTRIGDNTTNAPETSHAPLVHDPVRGVLVLVAGRDSGGNITRDTWELSPQTVWTRTNSIPGSERVGHAVAYDSARGRIVMFGGEDRRGTLLGETVERDSGTRMWTVRTPANRPSARKDMGLAFLPERGITLLFGGFDGARQLADTWQWNGTDWTLLAPATSPPPLADAVLVHDPTRARTVLFGRNASGSTETWEYDGATWIARAPAGSPRVTAGFAGGFDAGRGSVFVFGGSVPDPVLGPVATDDVMLYAPFERASWTPYGQGCAGSAGVPALVLDGRAPWLGDELVLRLDNAPAGPATGWTGFSSTTWNGLVLPYELSLAGLPGCRVFADIVASAPFVGGRYRVSIPEVGSLVGRSFFNQAFVLDPGHFPPAALSNAGAGVLQAK